MADASRACVLCPRQCAVRRLGEGGAYGFCGAGNRPRVFRWGPHFGEEPPITRARGSGCVFFSRCTMKCLYCQNSPWSWKGGGEDKSIAELTEIFRTLATKDRVENWNLVSPTPYLPFIREAVQPLFKEGIRLPFVWNSSGYERVETLEEYAELCDWALFDLRYSSNETAKLVSGAPDYVEHAREAIKWAANRILCDGRLGDPPLPKQGRGRPPGVPIPGIIVRILVLPGHADEAIESLAWLATNVSNEVAVSVMSQYTPAYKARETPPFDRGVTREEYESVTEAAADFGFENGWIQGFGAADPSLAFLGENMKENHGSV